MGYFIDESCFQDLTLEEHQVYAQYINQMVDEKIPFLIVVFDTFITNRQLVEKYQRWGYRVGVQHFFSTALATVSYLRYQDETKNNCVVYGSQGMIEACNLARLYTNLSPVDYVIIADELNTSLQDYQYVFEYLEKGAQLICVNQDISFVRNHKKYIGAGGICMILEKIANTNAIYIGNTPLYFHQACLYLKEKGMVVSNRMEHLIPAIQFGLQTVLITDDFTDNDSILIEEHHPTYIVESLAAISSLMID